MLRKKKKALKKGLLDHCRGLSTALPITSKTIRVIRLTTHLQAVHKDFANRFSMYTTI